MVDSSFVLIRGTDLHWELLEWGVVEDRVTIWEIVDETTVVMDS